MVAHARTIGVTLAVLGSWVAGCAGNDQSPAEARAEAVTELADDLLAETDGALDDDEATCVADALVAALGVDGLDELVRADRTASVDDGPDEAVRTHVIDAFSSCDALEALLDLEEPAG